MTIDFLDVALAIVVALLLILAAVLAAEARSARAGAQEATDGWGAAVLDLQAANEGREKANLIAATRLDRICALDTDLRTAIAGLGDAIATVTSAARAGKAGDLTVVGGKVVQKAPPTSTLHYYDGRQWNPLPGARPTFAFDGSFRIHDVSPEVLGLFYGGEVPARRPESEATRLNALLATEKRQHDQLRKWLILILSRDAGTPHVASERALHKAAAKFELREERLDGTLQLRVRPKGLGDDVPEKTL